MHFSHISLIFSLTSRSFFSQISHSSLNISLISLISLTRLFIFAQQVARYKYPPSWIPLETQFLAMSGGDPIAEHSRGWAVVTAGPAPDDPPELLNTSANTMMETAGFGILGLLMAGCGIGACGAMHFVKMQAAKKDGAQTLMGGGGAKPMEMGALSGAGNADTL